MRCIVTGVDEAGRSCVVGETTFPAGLDRVSQEVFFSSSALSPRPPGRGSFTDLHVPPGGVRWLVVRFAPHQEAPSHHTDTLDLDTVLEGTMELVLDDGVHVLHRGDSVVVTGVDHAWRTGAEACVMSFALFGTPPPA